MELFRVGGDVPDTNYLFMGMHSSSPGFCRTVHCQGLLADRIPI